MFSRFKILSLGLPRNKQFYIGLLVSGLQAFSVVALMACSGWLISRAAEQPPVMDLSIAVVGVRAFAMGRAAFRYSERVLLHDSVFRQLTALRPKIFAKLIPFAPTGLVQNNRIDSMNRLVSDVDELQNLSLRIIPPVTQSAVAVASVTIAMLFFEPNVAAVLLLAALVSFVVALPLAGLLSRNTDRALVSQRSALAMTTGDFIENLELLTAYGWQDEQLQEIAKRDGSLRSASYRTALSFGVGSGSMFLLSIVSVLGCGWFGALSVIEGRQPGVMLAVFVLLPIALFDVLVGLQSVSVSWQRYRASALRVSALLDRELPKEIPAAAGGTDLPTFETLELRAVSANYPGNKKFALQDVDLTINAGETLAVMGVSGSGKSTLINLLVGFLAPAAGGYLINGKTVDSYNSDSIRRRFGYLEQNPTIFNGSVRANLAFAKPGVTDDELRTALSKVGLLAMFEAREGLETKLGDSGVLVSGGEAQRLALARALIADFDLILFDEPTTNVSVDLGLELVQDLLKIASVESGKTVILVTHDSESAALAQRQIQLPS